MPSDYTPKLFRFDPAKYDYDPTRPRRVIRFIERYLRHDAAQHAGKPFKLLDWQKDCCHNLYGQLRKGTTERRFRFVFCGSPKQVGKSPFIAALALWHAFGEEEAAPEIVSAAATFSQARVVFDKAKRMIRLSDELAARAEILHSEIRVPSRGAVWRITSGIAKGKSGHASSFVALDELHEYGPRDYELLRFLESNLRKRRNSVMVIATNAGFDLNTPCGEWWKKAEQIEAGLGSEDDVLPVLFAAPRELPPDDPKTWAVANPSLDLGPVTTDDYKAEWAKVQSNPSQLPYFERLWLGRWVAADSAWLDPHDIAACIVDELPPDLTKLPLWVGVDMGKVDDLSVAAFVWADVENDRFFVKTLQWYPKPAAVALQDRASVPMFAWADKGLVKLIDRPTIDVPTKREIAETIAGEVEGHDLRMICFDRTNADELVHILDKDRGFHCEPVAQTPMHLGTATSAFERRIKEGSIRFIRDDCFLWQLSHCAVRLDKGGNPLVCKPASELKKIDAVQATIIAFSRAYTVGLKPDSDGPDLSKWDGSIDFI